MKSETKATLFVLGGLMAVTLFISAQSGTSKIHDPTVYVSETYECSQMNTRMAKQEQLKTVNRPSTFDVTYAESDKNKAIIQFNFSSVHNAMPASTYGDNEWTTNDSNGKITVTLGDHPMASYIEDTGFEVHTIIDSCKKIIQK